LVPSGADERLSQTRHRGSWFPWTEPQFSGPGSWGEEATEAEEM